MWRNRWNEWMLHVKTTRWRDGMKRREKKTATDNKEIVLIKLSSKWNVLLEKFQWSLWNGSETNLIALFQNDVQTCTHALRASHTQFYCATITRHHQTPLKSLAIQTDCAHFLRNLISYKILSVSQFHYNLLLLHFFSLAHPLDISIHT